MKFTKFLRTPILKNICQRLLLYCIRPTRCYLFTLSIPSSSSSLLLLLITLRINIKLMFVFDSDSKDFKEFKSSISFSLNSLLLVSFSFSMFSVFFSFVSFFLVAANKKDSFKLRIDYNGSAHVYVIKMCLCS